MLPLKRLLCGFVFAVIAMQGFSQEQLGLRLGNYSGINGTLFNPAFNVNSPLRWDINLIPGGAFVENNYVFIKDASVLKIIKNKNGFDFAGSDRKSTRLNSS